MSNGLITLIGNPGDSAIVTATRPGPHHVDIPVDVATANNYDTTAYNTSTGAGMFGSTGTAPVTFDAASRWANDAAVRANIGFWGGVGSGAVLAPYSNNALAGTKSVSPGSALYNNGIYPDLFIHQNVVQYAGDPTYELTVLGANLGSSAPTPQPALGLPGSTFSIVVAVRRFFPSGFTATGNATSSPGIAFNAGQNNAFKSSPVGGMNNGRASLELSNGTGVAQLFTNPTDLGSTIAESASGDTIGTWFSDNLWYDVVMEAEQFTGANGNTWISITFWNRKIGDANYTRMGYRRTQDTGGTNHAAFLAASGFPLNYNQSRSTDLKYYIWGHAAWNMVTNADPLSIKVYENTLTPDASSLGAFSTKTSSTATFPITFAKFAKYLRPVIDGVEDASQEYALPKETPDVLSSTNGTSNTTHNSISRTVTGLATGTRVISFNVYNGNKSAHVNTGNQSVTI